MNFKEYHNNKLSEKMVNLTNHKEKYVDEVWDLIQNAYKSIEGIKGSGFSSKEAMMSHIKMWKLNRSEGKIIAGILYKDKTDLRKSVAVFTDGSQKGKNQLTKMLKDDFSRSSIEVSHDLLRFIERKMPEMIKKYAVPSSEVGEILGKEVKIISDYTYEREINGTKITKMMLGTQKKF